MTAVLLAPAAVLVLHLYAVVLVVLRAKVYRVALYRPVLLNIGLSTLPVVTAIGIIVDVLYVPLFWLAWTSFLATAV
ncbi:hypothetical protein [Microbacterium enclense]|uniref:hypothetical protein n=1 Tax=Microbacterium enclense TaxID=993073 RepID=UPI003D727BA3